MVDKIKVSSQVSPILSQKKKRRRKDGSNPVCVLTPIDNILKFFIRI